MLRNIFLFILIVYNTAVSAQGWSYIASQNDTTKNIEVLYVNKQGGLFARIVENYMSDYTQRLRYSIAKWDGIKWGELGSECNPFNEKEEISYVFIGIDGNIYAVSYNWGTRDNRIYKYTNNI